MKLYKIGLKLIDQKVFGVDPYSLVLAKNRKEGTKAICKYPKIVKNLPKSVYQLAKSYLELAQNCEDSSQKNKVNSARLTLPLH